MIVNLLHDIIYEKVPLELFLQDKDLVFGLDAVVTVKPPDFEVLRKDTRMKISHHCIILIQGLDLTLESTQVFFNLQNLEILLLRLIFLFSLFDEVKQGYSRILLFINTTNDLTMMDVLILSNLWKVSTDFFILTFNLTVLDCVVMDHEITGEDQDLLLTQKADTEQVRLSDRITLHKFKLLQIDIEEDKLIITLHQERHLSTIIQEAVIANMQRLDDKAEVFYFRLDEDRSRRLLVQLVFIADQGIGTCHQHCRVKHRQDYDLKWTLTNTKLRCQKSSDLPEETSLRPSDGRQLQNGSFRKKQSLFLEVVIDCISYHCNKNQSPYLHPSIQFKLQMQNQQQTHPVTSEEQIEKKFYEKLNHFYADYFLTNLQQVAVSNFIKVHLGNKSNSKVDRIRPWILAKINQSYIPPPSPLQKGCPDIIPGLRAKPWWGRQEFPWLQHFEDNYQKIRDQLLTLRNQKGFQPYRGPSWISQRKAKDGVGNESIDSGMWNVFYLELHNMKFDYNCQKVPFIMQMINTYIPNNYHHAFISALTTNSHIMKHYGPTNKKLRFHLPLSGVKNSRMRVGDQIREQEEGKAYVFDDSFEHQAWHEGNQTRIILIVDFWHPDLSKEEIKLLTVLQNARFRAEATISQMDPDKDNFYSIIESAKDLIQNNEWWVVDEKEKPNPQPQQTLKEVEKTNQQQQYVPKEGQKV